MIRKKWQQAFDDYSWMIVVSMWSAMVATVCHLVLEMIFKL